MDDIAAALGTTSPRLTSLAHGGGCGCKLAPAVLREILARMPQAGPFPDLLVGTETADDAAVYRLNADQALVATTDFFTPIVDDPGDFGRIAATNALSDVYAMGGAPVLALAIVGYPVDKLAAETVQAILAGGAAVCAEAGIPVAGGHSIDSAEPIYGLVALGLVRPDQVRRNSGARPGDALILTKGLGVGVFSAALKAGRLAPEDYATMLASTTQLNRVGPALAAMDAVHAITDVTGFGLLGHLLEMCRGSGLRAALRAESVPLLPGAAPLAQAGVGTGAARRNWASYGAEVALAPGLAPWWQGMLCDPQTSGGLLVAVAPDAAAEVLDLVRRAGFGRAAVVGRLEAGVPGVDVEG
jgi:selenide,water dikinase